MSSERFAARPRRLLDAFEVDRSISSRPPPTARRAIARQSGGPRQVVVAATLHILISEISPPQVVMEFGSLKVGEPAGRLSVRGRRSDFASVRPAAGLEAKIEFGAPADSAPLRGGRA